MEVIEEGLEVDTHTITWHGEWGEEEGRERSLRRGEGRGVGLS